MLTKSDIEKYFIAEKNESLLFIIIGIAAISLSILFFFYYKSAWHKGCAVPLIIVGALHLLAGITIYNRSNADRIRNVYALDMNPQQLKLVEIPRMKLVNRNFVTYRYIELGLLLLGIALYYYFRNNTTKAFWAGMGIALAIEAAISLGADFFAEQRANEYTGLLINFTEKSK